MPLKSSGMVFWNRLVLRRSLSLNAKRVDEQSCSALWAATVPKPLATAPNAGMREATAGSTSTNAADKAVAARVIAEVKGRTLDSATALFAKTSAWAAALEILETLRVTSDTTVSASAKSLATTAAAAAEAMTQRNARSPGRKKAMRVGGTTARNSSFIRSIGFLFADLPWMASGSTFSSARLPFSIVLAFATALQAAAAMDTTGQAAMRAGLTATPAAVRIGNTKHETAPPADTPTIAGIMAFALSDAAR
mmetsp:Transcript_21757/g.43671  ORF Transcript_21757/g.43671 Transcript_21757/m.43671 type:complete len:251 (+) Transcript_21757:396-1148(+)